MRISDTLTFLLVLTPLQGTCPPRFDPPSMKFSEAIGTECSRLKTFAR